MLAVTVCDKIPCAGWCTGAGGVVIVVPAKHSSLKSSVTYGCTGNCINFGYCECSRVKRRGVADFHGIFIVSRRNCEWNRSCVQHITGGSGDLYQCSGCPNKVDFLGHRLASVIRHQRFNDIAIYNNVVFSACQRVHGVSIQLCRRFLVTLSDLLNVDPLSVDIYCGIAVAVQCIRCAASRHRNGYRLRIILRPHILIIPGLIFHRSFPDIVSARNKSAGHTISVCTCGNRFRNIAEISSGGNLE